MDSLHARKDYHASVLASNTRAKPIRTKNVLIKEVSLESVNAALSLSYRLRAHFFTVGNDE